MAARPAPDRGAHRHADAEGHEGRARRVRRVVDRRVRIDRRRIDDHRAVRRDVDHLGVGGLDHDHGLVLHHHRIDLSAARWTRARPCPVPSSASLARRPSRRPAGRGRRSRARSSTGCRRRAASTTSGTAAIDWTARVPRLRRHRVGERLVLEVRVLDEPLLKLDDLERVGGRHERLGQQLVRVQRDRCHERLQLVGAQRSRGGRIRWRRGSVGSCAVSLPAPESTMRARAQQVNTDVSGRDFMAINVRSRRTPGQRRLALTEPAPPRSRRSGLPFARYRLKPGSDRPPRRPRLVPRGSGRHAR